MRSTLDRPDTHLRSLTWASFYFFFFARSANGCNHRFCGDCWVRYLIAKIQVLLSSKRFVEQAIPRNSAVERTFPVRCARFFCRRAELHFFLRQIDTRSPLPFIPQTGLVKGIKCMSPECKFRVLPEQIETLLANNQTQLTRYKRFLRVQETNENPNKMWCLTRGCDGVLEAKGKERGKVACGMCSSAACFSCKVPWHAGVSCVQYRTKQVQAEKKARQKNEKANERAFEALMSKNTRYKQCRGCKVYLEKTFGCDKMKCRCGFRFCWRCGSTGAKCNCTGRNHGFWDNETGRGDFENL